MRTYGDILDWANKQKLLPIEPGRMTDNFQNIFSLPIPSEKEMAYPLLGKVQVGEDYAVLYYKNEPFSLYYSGEQWDYSHWILNESVWRKAREYVFQSLSILEPVFPQTTPLEADIEPLEGKFVWEALPKEERPTMYTAKRNFILINEDHPEWCDEVLLVGLGYTEELAIDDLKEQTIGCNGEFIGPLVVGQLQHEEEEE